MGAWTEWDWRISCGGGGSCCSRARSGSQIVAELLERSPEFVELRGRHEVAKRFEDHKTLVHPELGRIEVDCQILYTEDRSQTLLVMTTRPGTESHSKLQLLSVIGQQQFTR